MLFRNLLPFIFNLNIVFFLILHVLQVYRVHSGKTPADRRPRRSRQEVLRNRYTHLPVIVSFTLGYGLIHVPKFGIVELYHLRNQ